MNNSDQQGYESKNGSDPAQPVVGVVDSGGHNCGQLFHGLTKREHFAVEFMKAEIIGVYSTVEKGEYHNWNHDDFTREALGHADALLAALEKQQ